MFPTVSQSKFAQPDWKDHFAVPDYSAWEVRGQASAAEVLRATDARDVISPSERLRALTDAVPSVRAKLAATVQTCVEPACEVEVDPEPAPVDTKPATTVFAALSETVVRVAADPEAKRDEERARDRNPLKGANREGVKESWGDAEVAAKRLTREGVRVTLPSGEARQYSCVREAFGILRLPMKKHIRFRQKLKEARELAFDNDGGDSYVFKLVPRE